MMSKGHPAVSLAAVLVTAAAATAVSAPVQAAPKAAPTCYATTCYGLDPIASHCVDDAVTIDDAVLDGRIVRLRYSAECRAAWAQLWFGKPGDRAYVRSEDNGKLVAVQSITVTPWDGNSVYTPMVNDKGLKAKACSELPSLPPDSDTACTIFY
ncbi:YjfA family protein [Streptomyces sp. NPDC060028]|uniref:YjfA family protein n=1 Tax=Streptomyces sp. NPDC060028 TaxID=3347041 RepID=UPI0036D1D71A